jgi:hypothetical protein
MSRIEAEKIGAVTAMKQKVFRVSAVLGTGGVIAAAVLSGASAASAAAPPAPSWHPVLSGQGGGVVTALVATGKTSGWAFLGSGAAYERVGATSWKQVALPGQSGLVTAAAASSPSNVWADFRPTAGGSQLDRWNGRRWAVVKSFPGTITTLSVLGPDDVWAFGGANGGGAFHFNGRGWAEVSSTLQDGSASSDTNVWAFSGTQLARYDGRRWTETDVAGLFPAVSGHHGEPFLTGVLALSPDNVFATGVGWGSVGGGAAVVLHFNGHAWSLVANGPAVVIGSGASPAPDGRGGLWMTARTHENYDVLLHYSAGQVVDANEPFASVASIPGTDEALGGSGGLGASLPTVWQYF